MIVQVVICVLCLGWPVTGILGWEIGRREGRLEGAADLAAEQAQAQLAARREARHARRPRNGVRRPDAPRLCAVSTQPMGRVS